MGLHSGFNGLIKMTEQSPVMRDQEHLLEIRIELKNPLKKIHSPTRIKGVHRFIQKEKLGIALMKSRLDQ